MSHTTRRHRFACYDVSAVRCRIRPSRHYRPPRLIRHGRLGALVRGASWKGVDSVGELDPDQSYPG